MMAVYSDHSNFKFYCKLFEKLGSDRITAIAAQNDKVYSADSNGTIVESDFKTQTALRTLETCFVRQLSVSGNQLIGIPYGFDSPFVIEWDLMKAKIVRRITFEKSITTVVVQGPHLYTTHAGSTKIEKWDIRTTPATVHLLSFEGHLKHVFSLAIDNSDRLYSGSEDLSLRGWNCKTGANLWVAQLDRCAFEITTLGQSVIFCPTDYHAYELDKETGQLIGELRTNGGVLYSITSSNNFLIAGSRVSPLSLESVSIRVWEKQSKD